MIKLKDLLLLEQVFDLEQAEKGVKDIEKKIDAPHVKAGVSTLGGKHQPGIGIHISLDEKSTWKNNIFHNSRYMIFMFDWNGTLKLLSAGQIDSHTDRPSYGKESRITFRKSKAKSIDDAIKRINKAIAETKKRGEKA